MRLIENTMKFCADTENEAKALIEKYREEAGEKGYILKKAGYEYKTKKAKGEIIGEAWLTSVTLVYGELWETIE